MTTASSPLRTKYHFTQFVLSSVRHFVERLIAKWTQRALHNRLTDTLQKQTKKNKQKKPRHFVKGELGIKPTSIHNTPDFIHIPLVAASAVFERVPICYTYSNHCTPARMLAAE